MITGLLVCFWVAVVLIGALAASVMCLMISKGFSNA